MKIINDKLIAALFGGGYICPKCGGKMEFEDDIFCDVLVCSNCGESMDYEMYGFDSEEEYEELYYVPDEYMFDDMLPSYEEEYDEVCGELDDYVITEDD